MTIDIELSEAKSTPATERKDFPLAYLVHLLLTGDNNGMRAYAKLLPYRKTESGGEIKTPEVDGDATIVDVPNVLPMADSGDAGNALVEQTIAAFLSSGGNILTLTMAALLLSVQQLGVATGKLGGGND